MTTKQKIIASIWVPIVSMYLQIISVIQLYSIRTNFNLIQQIKDITTIFLIAGILWIPTLIICLILENSRIKDGMENPPISKILGTEAFICAFTIWLPTIIILETPEIVIFMLISLILSITARWGYLKWRKLC